MRLFDLVEQDDRVRPATNDFGELAALVVADVTGWSADHARDGVLFLVLRHVEADESLLVVEQELSERACQLRLAHTGRAEKDERADRAVGVGEA